MQRKKMQSIGEALADFLRESGLEKPIMERRIVELWPQVMGESVARLTREVEVTDGVLYVRLNSAALRSQLFEIRFDLVRRLNEAVGCEGVIRDVRLL